MKISATILLNGSPKRIQQVVKALEPLDEVLIYNNGASEEVLASCRPFPNVRIASGPFTGFGPTHNKASSLARNDWILSIDSDEVPTAELVEEIQNTALDPKRVYSIPRRNFYRGKWIRGCGWWPDQALRLYNKQHTQFSDAQVHEKVETKGMSVINLKNCLQHYSYDTISDFLSKMQSYSALFAKEWAGKKNSNPCKAALHGFFAFFKSYFIKWGIRDGYEGFLISAYNGHTAFYKYLKLYETNLSNLRCPDEKASFATSREETQK